MNSRILGVDIGGVIIDAINNDETDTSFFSHNYLYSAPVQGAFEALGQLNKQGFGGRVYLVSKCGETIRRKTRNWLRYRRFYELTGISREHVRFCTHRREKANLCKELDITHFIDDHLEMLACLENVVAHRFLFQGKKEEIARFHDHLSSVKHVQSWEEILQALLP